MDLHHEQQQQQQAGPNVEQLVEALAAVAGHQLSQQTNNAIERELLNYPTLVLQQQQQQQHEHNLPAQGSHQHGALHTAETTNIPATIAPINGYQTHPSVYETALEAVKHSYNILPTNTNTSVAETQNNDMVNALIGEYFGQNESESIGVHHDHSQAHTEHSIDVSVPADSKTLPEQVHGFNHVNTSYQLNQPVQQLPAAIQQEQTAPVQNMAASQHIISEASQQKIAIDLVSTTTRDNVDSIRSRREMNAILQERTKAEEAVKLATEELQRARNNLEKAKDKKAQVDEQVIQTANALTDGLLKENSKWNDMYSKLVNFKEKYGHCDVTRNPYRSSSKQKMRDKESAEQNELITLGTWVGRTRLAARQPPGHPDRLEPYKVVALNRIGFEFEPRENYWMSMYDQLKVHLEENDGKMPLRVVNGEKNPLGQWCETQCENYKQFQKGSKKAYITQERIDLLDKIG